ncbi:MAG TPA: GGDEF domain-containing protein [Rhizobacter sp.]
MKLDIQTILVVLLANVWATAVALPLLMGWRVSPAARLFQAGMAAHAASWAFFLVAPRLHDRALTSVALGLMALSFALLGSALQHWLGPRPGGRSMRGLMWALVAAVPIVYALAYPSYPVRVGLSNALFALQMLLVCVALASPAPQASWRWRGLVLASFVALGVVTVWRGVLGAFFTEAYPFYRATHPVNVTAVFINHVALSLCTLGLLAAWREEAERELRRQAQTDGLTGLLNRQAFLERAHTALAHAWRYDETLTLLMLDIDHFKRINDQHGHAAGDAALKTVAQGLRACTRGGDLVCRYGGEEFCVLLSRATAADALRFDERLRAWLVKLADETGAARIDYSAGIAVRQPDDRTMDELLLRADTALYRAKADGRGRVAGTPAAGQKELTFDLAL